MDGARSEVPLDLDCRPLKGPHSLDAHDVFVEPFCSSWEQPTAALQGLSTCPFPMRALGFVLMLQARKHAGTTCHLLG